MTSVLQSIRARLLRRTPHDRGAVLARVMKRLSEAHAPSHFSTLWTDAIFGWGNERWTAEERYLSEVVHLAEKTGGSILECGSGLSTLLVATVAARQRIHLHSLEHIPEWHARVTGAIRDFGLTSVTAHLAPLREYGAYDWYDAPMNELPSDFSLVICDGPPGVTRGGRSGMLPIMRDKLAAPFSILLDDTNRPAERALVQEWTRALGARPDEHSNGRGFARIDVRGLLR